MKKILILIILFSVIPLQAEYLFLKDGTIIKCKVIEETGVQIIIRNEKDKIEVYPQNKVLRVLFTELNMGKIYVQLKNGESLKVYMIDEDRDTYTVRKDITKPEEFKIKRADVMFITERNPSALKGEQELYSISLTWFPPFDKMEKFNIYIKKKKEDSYSLAASSKKNNFLIKNLTSNTKYFIKVTGVDSDNAETPPSNEIEILTKNLPPEKPLKAIYEKTEDGNFLLKWDNARDPDGKIAKYIISKTFNKKTEKVAESQTNEMLLKKPVEFENLYVRAVDDRGDESPEIKMTEIVNQPPTSPAKVQFEKLKTGEIKLTWKASTDRDGKVIKYNIYRTLKNKKEIISSSQQTTFTVKSPFGFDSLYVAAVDNKWDESGHSKAVPHGALKFLFQVNPAVLFPVDKLAIISDVGYGSYIFLGLDYLGFITGFETGIFNFNGKRTNTEGVLTVDRMLFIPMGWLFGYRISLPKNFDITPFLSGGMAYFNTSTKVPEQRELNFFAPIAKAVILFDYKFNELFTMGIAGEYGLIFQSASLMMYASVSVNLMFRF